MVELRFAACLRAAASTESSTLTVMLSMIKVYVGVGATIHLQFRRITCSAT